MGGWVGGEEPSSLLSFLSLTCRYNSRSNYADSLVRSVTVCSSFVLLCTLVTCGWLVMKLFTSMFANRVSKTVYVNVIFSLFFFSHSFSKQKEKLINLYQLSRLSVFVWMDWRKLSRFSHRSLDLFCNTWIIFSRGSCDLFCNTWIIFSRGSCDLFCNTWIIWIVLVVVRVIYFAIRE